MFGKMMLVTLGIALSACAKANYQEAPVDNNSAAAPAASCALYLKSHDLCADLEWEQMPTADETGSFFLRFYNPAAPTVFVEPTAKLSVVLWMPSMGHGSSPVKIENLTTGIYRVHSVFFVMPGDWEIRIKLKNDKNQVDEAILSLSI